MFLTRAERAFRKILIQDWDYPQLVFRPTCKVKGLPAVYGAFLPDDLQNPVVDNMMQNPDGGWMWTCYNVVATNERLTKTQLARRIYHAERMDAIEELINMF